MGSQAWADGRTKINIAPKNIHTLFFLFVVGDSECHVVPVRVDSTTESTDVYEDSDGLHRNNSYNPMQIDKDNTCTILVFLFLILLIFSCVCMMSRPRLISCYYIYVDEYSDKCIDQSGMIGMTDASRRYHSYTTKKLFLICKVLVHLIFS